MTVSAHHPVLYDTDFIIALCVPEESTHHRAKAIFSKHLDRDVYVLRIISYELATVVSRKFGYRMAQGILKTLTQLPIHFMDIAILEDEIWQEYQSYTKKNISFFDCANLVTARRYDFKIASFDGFYPASLRI